MRGNRLHAMELGQFFPTPPEVLEAIPKSILLDSHYVKDGARILDPSCGCGEAVKFLSTAWNHDFVPFGNEIEGVRYLEAKELLDGQVTHGPFETYQPNGQFDIVFMNPPYVYDLEIEHTELAGKMLRNNGLMIGVYPRSILEDVKFWKIWNVLFRYTGYWRFPENLRQFDQYVIAGTKKRWSHVSYRAAINHRDTFVNGDWPIIGSAPEQYGRRVYLFGNGRMNPKNDKPGMERLLDFLPQLGSGLDDDLWHEISDIPDEDVNRPATFVIPAHAIQLAACGMIDGQRILVDGKDWLMSVTSYKYEVIEEVEITDDDDAIEEVVEHNAYLVRLLNLESGEYREIDSRHNEEDYLSFVEDYTQIILDAVQESNPPRYNGDYGFLLDYYNQVHAPRDIGLEDGLLNPQKHDVAALCMALDKFPAVIYAGDPGIGKTFSSIVLAAIRSGMLDGKPGKVVFYSPEQPAYKTAQEAESILRDVPGLKVKVIGQDRKRGAVPGRGWPFGNGGWPGLGRKKKTNPITEVDNLMSYNGPAIMIVPYNVGKMGAPWEHVVKFFEKTLSWEERYYDDVWGEWQTRTVEETNLFAACPFCKKTLYEDEVPLTQDDIKNKGSGRQKRWCQYCHEPLWQVKPYSYGGRWPIAEYISQHWRGKYFLIVDELHRTKGSDTDLGYATMDLISGAVEILGLTATLYNGYAPSLFYMLYRISPSFRKKYTLEDEQKYASRHGLLAERRRVTYNTSGYSDSGYRRMQKLRTSYAPGATPWMVNELIPFTVFRHIDQMGVELFDSHKVAIPCDLSDEMQAGKQQLDSFYAHAISVIEENRAPFAQWFQAALGWYDNPVNDVVGKQELTGVSDDHITPKEAKVMNILLDAVDENKGVVLFFRQVNRRCPIPRYTKLLDKEGLHYAVLTSDIRWRGRRVSAVDRVEWLEYQVERLKKKGQPPILLAGDSLLVEGVDMLDFHTIFEIGQDFHTTRLMQRLGRFRRLGMERPVEVYFMYYTGTIQEKALPLVVNKVAAADQIQGRVSGVENLQTSYSVIQKLMEQASGLGDEEYKLAIQTRLVSDVYVPRVERQVVPKHDVQPSPSIVELVAFAQQASKREVVREAQLSFF